MIRDLSRFPGSVAFRRCSASLKQKLEHVRKKIDTHPLSSPPVKSAFDVIERHGKENSDAISKELSERGLPSLDELGKLQIRHMFSWWSINRQKRVLEKKLG